MNANLIKYIAIFFLLIAIGCRTKKETKEENTAYKTSMITIKANDLSEDRNAFSSGNDELMFFIFGDSANDNHVLLYNTYHIVRKTPDTVSYSLQKIVNPYKSYTMVLVEIDENTVIDQIIADSIGNNIDRLEKAFTSKDLETISAIIKDNDLLGIKRVDHDDLFLRKSSMEFKGTHLFDKYDYKVYWE